MIIRNEGKTFTNFSAGNIPQFILEFQMKADNYSTADLDLWNCLRAQVQEAVKVPGLLLPTEYVKVWWLQPVLPDYDFHAPIFHSKKKTH